MQRVPTFHANHISFPEFQRYWGQGIPVVITHVKLQGSWDPEYFIDMFGDKNVTIQNCETGKTRVVLLEKFFRDFGKPREKDAEIWKVKVCYLSLTRSAMIREFTGLASACALSRTLS
jgi:hypothetical protein